MLGWGEGVVGAQRVGSGTGVEGGDVELLGPGVCELQLSFPFLGKGGVERGRRSGFEEIHVPLVEGVVDF